MLREGRTLSRDDLYILILLAALPFVCFPFALRGDTLIVSGDAIIDFSYRILTARRVFSGEWPFWAPDIYGGSDMWAYPISGALNPFTYLFGILPPLLFYNVFFIFVYSISLCGTFIFARRWGLNRPGAALAAISYTFSGFFYSYYDFNVHSITQAAAFTPWLLTAYHYLAQKPGPRRAALAALATFFLGNVPQEQIFFYSMIHAGFITFVMWMSSGAAGRWKIWLWAAAAVVLGTAAFSVRIFPTWALLSHSVRGGAVRWLNEGATIFNIVKWHTIFNPYEDKWVLANAFFGEFPFFLMLLALLGKWGSAKVRWAMVGMIIGWLGLFSGLIPAGVSEKIPLLNWFQWPVRHLFEMFLWASVLAGIGLDGLVGNERGKRLSFFLAFAATLLLGCSLLIGFHFIREDAWANIIKSDSFIGLVVFAAIAAFSLIFMNRGNKLKWALIVLIIASVIAQRQTIFGKMVKKRIKDNGTIAADLQRPPVVDFLRARERSVHPDGPGARGIFMGFFINEKFPISDRVAGAAPNWNMLYDFPLVQGRNEFVDARLEYMLNTGMRHGSIRDTSIFKSSECALDLLNVRYVLFSSFSSATNAPDSWPLYREYITKNYSSSVEPIIDFNNSLSIKLDIKEGQDRLIILARHPVYGIPDGVNAAMFALTAADGTQIVRMLTTERKSEGVSPEIISLESRNRLGLVEKEHVYEYLIQIPFTATYGNSTIEMKVIHPEVSLEISDAVVLDKKDQVLAHLPILESYLESTLGYSRIYKDSSVTAFERPSAFPRQWLASGLAIGSPDKILNALTKASGLVDRNACPKDIAFVEDRSLVDFGKLMASVEPDKSATINRIGDGPNSVTAKIKSKTPVFAVFSEAWAPGWKAELDGKPAPVYITDFYLRGIAVPSGEHIIRMEYTPPGFRVGMVISIIAALTIITLAIIPSKKKTTNEGGPGI